MMVTSKTQTIASRDSCPVSRPPLGASYNLVGVKIVVSNATNIPSLDAFVRAAQCHPEDRLSPRLMDFMIHIFCTMYHGLLPANVSIPSELAAFVGLLQRIAEYAKEDIVSHYTNNTQYSPVFVEVIIGKINSNPLDTYPTLVQHALPASLFD